MNHNDSKSECSSVERWLSEVNNFSRSGRVPLRPSVALAGVESGDNAAVRTLNRRKEGCAAALSADHGVRILPKCVRVGRDANDRWCVFGFDHPGHELRNGCLAPSPTAADRRTELPWEALADRRDLGLSSRSHIEGRRRQKNRREQRGQSPQPILEKDINTLTRKIREDALPTIHSFPADAPMSGVYQHLVTLHQKMVEAYNTASIWKFWPRPRPETHWIRVSNDNAKLRGIKGKSELYALALCDLPNPQWSGWWHTWCRAMCKETKPTVSAACNTCHAREMLTELMHGEVVIDGVRKPNECFYTGDWWGCCRMYDLPAPNCKPHKAPCPCCNITKEQISQWSESGREWPTDRDLPAKSHCPIPLHHCILCLLHGLKNCFNTLLVECWRGLAEERQQQLVLLIQGVVSREAEEMWDPAFGLYM